MSGAGRRGRRTTTQITRSAAASAAWRQPGGGIQAALRAPAGARAVTDRQPISADTAVDCRVRHSQGGEAVNAAPPGTHGGHQRRLCKQQRMRRPRQSRVPVFLDQAGVPAKRLRQHAQLAGYRLDVTIPLAFPAGRLDAQQNAAPLFIKPPFELAGEVSRSRRRAAFWLASSPTWPGHWLWSGAGTACRARASWWRSSVAM